VGHQWLGRYGKIGNGVVTVTTVWAGERLYYPVHAVPYTPARHFAKGKADPAFRTKLAIGADLAAKARAAGSCSARSSRTARTAIRTRSAASSRRPACRS
jgi:SRSO17 transposase